MRLPSRKTVTVEMRVTGTWFERRMRRVFLGSLCPSASHPRRSRHPYIALLVVVEIRLGEGTLRLKMHDSPLRKKTLTRTLALSRTHRKLA